MKWLIFSRNKKSGKKLFTAKELLVYSRLPENTRFEYITQILADGFTIDTDNWRFIITLCPETEKLPVPWDKFSLENWNYILESLPHLADKCPCLDKFFPEQWCNLLKKHPELAHKCHCYKDFSQEIWIELCWHQMQFMEQASAFLSKENLLELALFHRIKQEKNIWFDPVRLKALLKEQDAPCAILVKRDGLPVWEHISHEWIKDIYQQEREKIYE